MSTMPKFALYVCVFVSVTAHATGVYEAWPNEGPLKVTPYHFVAYLYMGLLDKEPDATMPAKVAALAANDGEAQRQALFAQVLAQAQHPTGRELVRRMYTWLLGRTPNEADYSVQNANALDAWVAFNRVLGSQEFRNTNCTGTYAYGGQVRGGSPQLRDLALNPAHTDLQAEYVQFTPPTGYVGYESRVQPIVYRRPGLDRTARLLTMFRTRDAFNNVRTFPMLSNDEWGTLFTSSAATYLFPNDGINTLDADVRKIHNSCPDLYAVAAEVDRLAPAKHSSTVTALTAFPHNPYTYSAPKVLVQGCDVNSQTDACRGVDGSRSASSPTMFSGPQGNFLAMTSVYDGATPNSVDGKDDGTEFTSTVITKVAAFYDAVSRLSIINLAANGLAPMYHLPFTLRDAAPNRVNNIGAGNLSIEEAEGRNYYAMLANRSDYYRCAWSAADAAKYEGLGLTNHWYVDITLSDRGFGLDAASPPATRVLLRGPSGGYCSIQYPVAAVSRPDGTKSDLAIYVVETPWRGGDAKYVRYIIKAK